MKNLLLVYVFEFRVFANDSRLRRMTVDTPVLTQLPCRREQDSKHRTVSSLVYVAWTRSETDT